MVEGEHYDKTGTLSEKDYMETRAACFQILYKTGAGCSIINIRE